MRFEEHCRRTSEIFGQPYEEIHRWLDEFARNYSPSERYKHRKFRHHLEGIQEAREVFGDIGALVAALHILDDNDWQLPRKKEYEIQEYEE